MCGISAVIGAEYAPALALKICLVHQHRGKDATGIAYLGSKGIHELKRAISPEAYSKQYLKELEAKLKNNKIAIAHNRFATCNQKEKHLDKECHPFMSEDKSFTLLQNGSVPFAPMMGAFLEATSHKFSSGVDSEVLTHMLEDILKNTKDREEAFNKFFVDICVGNVIVLFKDGELWGLAGNDDFFVVMGDNLIFIASELESITKTVKDTIDKCKVFSTKGDTAIRVFYRDNKVKYVTYGAWDVGVLKDGDWVYNRTTSCDFCSTYKRCERITIKTKSGSTRDVDRCFDCYKAGKIDLPSYPLVNQHYQRQSHGYIAPQQASSAIYSNPNIDQSKDLTVICNKCGLPHTNEESIICYDCNRPYCITCFEKHSCSETTKQPNDDLFDWLYRIIEKKAKIEAGTETSESSVVVVEEIAR